MNWEAVAIFVVGQVISLVWVLGQQRGDSRVLKTELGMLQVEVKKLGDVLVTMANFRGELNLMQERFLLQGKRLDLLQEKFDKITEIVQQ